MRKYCTHFGIHKEYMLPGRGWLVRVKVPSISLIFVGHPTINAARIVDCYYYVVGW